MHKQNLINIEIVYEMKWVWLDSRKYMRNLIRHSPFVKYLTEGHINSLQFQHDKDSMFLQRVLEADLYSTDRDWKQPVDWTRDNELMKTVFGLVLQYGEFGSLSIYGYPCSPVIFRRASSWVHWFAILDSRRTPSIVWSQRFSTVVRTLSSPFSRGWL